MLLAIPVSSLRQHSRQSFFRAQPGQRGTDYVLPYQISIDGVSTLLIAMTSTTDRRWPNMGRQYARASEAANIAIQRRSTQRQI